MKLDLLVGAQRRALLDLTLLAMYADGHLAAVEDQRVRSLLGALGCPTESEAAREYDEAIGRISRHAGSVATATDHAVELAKCFGTPAERQEVLAVLDQLVASDRHISVTETELLAALKEALAS
jgi:hypothetical protein